MKALLRLTLVLLLSVALWGANSPAAAKTKKKKAAVKAQPPVTQNDLKQLKDQLDAQQQQIQQLQQQVQQRDSQIQQLQSATNAASTKADTATAEASQNQQSLNGLQSNVSTLQSTTATTTATVAQTEKRVKDLENPLAIKYKGITLTPGGYVAADVLVRSRNMNADVATPFSQLPFGGIANSHLTEFRASARSSRISLLGEGKHGDSKLTGYFEMDFLGAAPTANQVETDAFTPRLRSAYLQDEMNNGFTFTAGQIWSLLTTDRKGIAPRSEFIPITIEAAYVVGYNYVRQNSFRVTKSFDDNKAWAAFEVANSETTATLTGAPSPLFGFNTSSNALTSSSGYLLPYTGAVPCTAPAGLFCNPGAASITNGISTNMSPDLLFKVAFEPGWGHFEIKALGRVFRDRVGTPQQPVVVNGVVAGNGTNKVSEGGGIGAAAILPVVAKKADLIVEGLVGAGIGRYGAANGSDVTVNPRGTIVPIKAVHAMAGLELHPDPKLDVFFYGGGEYYGRTAYVNATGGGVGYGSPLAINNTECNRDFIAEGTCGAQNKSIYDGTGGFWYRFYKGDYGTFQYGLQYEYLERFTWRGVGGAPKGKDNVFLTSFRYFIP